MKKLKKSTAILTLIMFVFSLCSTVSLASSSDVPIQLPTGEFVQISTGQNYSFALKSNGTLWGWGINGGGQVGISGGDPISTPTQLSGTYSKISNGYNHSLAIKPDGTLWAWGSNSLGEVGNGTTVRAYYPVQIGTGFSQVAASDAFSLALKSNGTLWTWGAGGLGRLGNGGTANISVPTQVGIKTYSQIATCRGFSLALDTDGKLWGWGYNGNGQLGIGTSGDINLSPVQIPGTYSKISAGEGFSLALKADGTLYAFGKNSNGQLGDGTLIDKLIPTQIGTQTYSQISAGLYHSLALTTNGKIEAWGKNDSGQLGDGTLINKSVPTQIGTDTYVQISAGGEHSLALKPDGKVYSCGANWNRQLGNSSPMRSSSLNVIPNLTLYTLALPIITINSYNTSTTNQDITVYASTDRGTLNATSHTFTSNSSFVFIATDGGNSTSQTVTISNIDKTAPVITITPYNTSSTNQNITVSVNTNEGSLNATSHLFTENGSFDFVATDIAGNITTQNVTITNIDKVAPVISIDQYNTNQTNQDVVVTASTNKGSLNSTTHIFTSNGSFDFIATDSAGNTTTQTITISNIDKILPVVTISNYSSLPTNQDIIVTASTDKGTLNSTTYTFTENGSFDFIASDSYGNITTQTVNITNIDKIAPAQPVITLDPGTPTNQFVTVSISYPVDGIINEYKVGDDTWKNYTYDFVSAINQDVFARTKDSAGNLSIETKLTISNIDRISPTINIYPYETTFTNSTVSVRAESTDGTLNQTIHVFTENGSFTFVSTDLAGNANNTTVTINNIDIIAPNSPTISMQDTTFVISPNGDTGVSGVSTTKYKIVPDSNQQALNNSFIIETFADEDLSGYINYTGATNVPVGSGKIYAVVLDNAGNVSVPNFVMYGNSDLAIVIDSYNTNPTNQDIIVTASAISGTLNTTTHTFTENGSFDFIATDIIGNQVTQTVTITNINKVAPPIPNIADNQVGNQDIPLSFSNAVIRLNGEIVPSGYVVNTDGVYHLVVTDLAGNQTTREFIFDKTPPKTPVISIVSGKMLTITDLGDNGPSGVFKVKYKIVPNAPIAMLSDSLFTTIYADGELDGYVDYTGGEIILPSGSGTLYVVSVDNAGNTSNPYSQTYNTQVYTDGLQVLSTNGIASSDMMITTNIEPTITMELSTNAINFSGIDPLAGVVSQSMTAVIQSNDVYSLKVNTNNDLLSASNGGSNSELVADYLAIKGLGSYQGLSTVVGTLYSAQGQTATQLHTIDIQFTPDFNMKQGQYQTTLNFTASNLQ